MTEKVCNRLSRAAIEARDCFSGFWIKKEGICNMPINEFINELVLSYPHSQGIQTNP